MIMERLKSGAVFADVAMDYSEDPGKRAARRRSRAGADYVYRRRPRRR